MTYNGTAYDNGDTIKVYAGGEITVKDVDGYSYAVEGDLKPTAFGSLKITYTAASTTGKVTSSQNNADAGTVTVGGANAANGVDLAPGAQTIKAEPAEGWYVKSITVDEQEVTPVYSETVATYSMTVATGASHTVEVEFAQKVLTAADAG